MNKGCGSGSVRTVKLAKKREEEAQENLWRREENQLRLLKEILS